MIKPQVVLVNWSLTTRGGDENPYQAPETVRTCLAGDVVGHPRFEDGHYVNTSPIVGVGTIDDHGYSPSYVLEGVVPLDIRDQMLVETSNTVYLLDGPHPNYKKWCDANSYECVS